MERIVTVKVSPRMTLHADEKIIGHKGDNHFTKIKIIRPDNVKDDDLLLNFSPLTGEAFQPVALFKDNEYLIPNVMTLLGDLMLSLTFYGEATANTGKILIHFEDTVEPGEVGAEEYPDLMAQLIEAGSFAQISGEYAESTGNDLEARLAAGEFKGSPGADGKSAYQAALDGGFPVERTETQFNQDLAVVHEKQDKIDVGAGIMYGEEGELKFGGAILASQEYGDSQLAILPGAGSGVGLQLNGSQYQNAFRLVAETADGSDASFIYSEGNFVELHAKNTIFKVTDTSISLYVGGEHFIFTGDGLDMAAKQITNLSAPTAQADAANKQYVDALTPRTMTQAEFDLLSPGEKAGTIFIIG